MCPDCLCCVASSASLSPLVFHVSRREVLAAVVMFFVCWLVLICGATHVILLDAFRSFESGVRQGRQAGHVGHA